MEIQPLTPWEARQWMERHAGEELVEKHLGSQPPAGESESRVTLRIPGTLKRRIEETAKSHNQSLNAWIMRCVEAYEMQKLRNRMSEAIVGADATLDCVVYPQDESIVVPKAGKAKIEAAVAHIRAASRSFNAAKTDADAESAVLEAESWHRSVEIIAAELLGHNLRDD